MKAKQWCLAAVMAGVAGSVSAGEGSFGWLYTLDLQPKGTLEFEQKIDLTTAQAAGKYNLWKTKTGLEYGVTNNFQLTGYLNGYSVSANQNYTNSDACGGSPPCTGGFGVPGSAAGGPYSKTQFDGASIEGIWRITNPVTDPVGVGVYGEVTKGTWVDAFEAKLLLQSNFLDDRLVVAANIVAEIEKYKFDESSKESMVDVLYGFTYRFAPKWFAGVEGRFHNDYSGYYFNSHTQRANFIGPNLHYAQKDWWITAAWRYQIGGSCYNDGVAECSGGKVWDSHGKNQFIVKFGAPF
jgi:hypothetical protein